VKRWVQVLLAVVGGGFLAPFLSMLLGLWVFGVAALFGLGDDLWDSEIAWNTMFILLFVASWAVCSGTIWKLLIRRRGA
jgi:hypothetical protein